jgi:hypothetical protein
MSRAHASTRLALRRAVARGAGAAWIGAWLAGLELLSRPWNDLGGVFSERWRWLARCCLVLAPAVGATAAALARVLAPPVTRRAYVAGLRVLFYPAAVPAALLLCFLGLRGEQEAIVVTLDAWLAYQAGVDAAYSAWPLMHGGLLAAQAGAPRGRRFPRGTG